MSDSLPSPPRKILAIYALDQDPRCTASLGIYHYTRNLIRALAGQPDPGFDVRLLLSADNAADLTPPATPPWMTAHVTAGGFATGLRRLLADHVLGPWLARRQQVAAIHYPKGYIPAWCPPGLRLVATLHDTILEYYARAYPRELTTARRGYFGWLTRHSLRRADRIMTDSVFSRDCLAALVPACADRLAVVYFGPGITPGGRIRIPAEPATRAGVLVLGSRRPHKATAETLRRLDRYASAKSAPLDVTVTGLPAWPPEWGAKPSRIGMTFLGRLDDDALEDRMAIAKALVLLSEIEGLGLPALESFAAGTPVCYRAGTALQEVLANVPGGWDGRDDASFAAALDAALSMTTSEIARVQARLGERFNWRRAVNDIVKVYRETMEQET